MSASHPRRHRLPGALLLLVLAAASGVACAPDRARGPAPDLSGSNLLLVSIDTLRADHVGAYGDNRAATPTLDRLASNGVRFANCYASVPLTLPSHSSMFTGRYPFELQVRNNGSYYLSAEHTTLAEQLRDHGYQTAAFVSSYVLGSKFGLAQGFESYDDRLGGDGPIHSLGSQVPADQVVDRFESWLRLQRNQESRSQQPEKPFFAWLHFYDPHLPYTPPEPYAGRFADDPYRGEIAFVDAQIARALAAAQRSSPKRSTLTVVLSDHGEAFGEHGEVGHGILTYDESLRVPLIFSGAGLPIGTTIEARARLVDLTPTLLELLQAASERPVSSDPPGKSLVPMITGEARNEAQVSREVYFESFLGAEDYNWAPITGIIAGNHKYIALPQPELYDLQADPKETKNLFHTETGIVEDLDRRLRHLLLSVDADAEPNRELSADDIGHLRALGYLGQAERSETVIDPKQGIRIDTEIKRIRGLIDSGDLDAASVGATALEANYADLNMPSLYALRHEIASRQGNAQAAVSILEDGLAALPGSTRLLFLLAHYLEQNGRWEEAEATSRRLLAVDPGFSEAHTILGRIAEAQGRFVESVTSYERALASEPLNTPLRLRYAEALLRSGEGEAALTAFNLVAKEGGLDDQPWLLYRVAMLNVQAGDLAIGETLFRNGLEAAPAGIHHLTFGLLLLENGKADEAVHHLTLAIEERPSTLSPQQIELAQATLARLNAGDPAP